MISGNQEAGLLDPNADFTYNNFVVKMWKTNPETGSFQM